jgi:hypothetical protein
MPNVFSSSSQPEAPPFTDHIDSRMTLLEELKALSKRLEAVCAKIKVTQDCLANSDVLACRSQAFKISQAVGDLSQAIPEYCPDEKEKKLYERAVKSVAADQVNTKALNKHLSFIFQGPKSSDFDSGQSKRRKNEVRERCNEIRRMSPQAILWWAKAFPPSVWSEDLMSRRTFEYLLHQMGQQKVPALQSDYDILTLIETKNPLNSCPAYQDFTRGQAHYHSVPKHSTKPVVSFPQRHSTRLSTDC